MDNFKKAIAALTAITTIATSAMSIASTTLSASATNAQISFVNGDIDGNGSVSISDWMCIVRYLSGVYTLSNEQATKADVNNDGVIDYKDSNIISDYVVGSKKPTTVKRNVLTVPKYEKRAYSCFDCLDSNKKVDAYEFDGLTEVTNNFSARAATYNPSHRADSQNKSVVEVSSSYGKFTGVVVGDNTILTTARAVCTAKGKTPKTRDIKFASSINISVYEDYSGCVLSEIPVNYIHVPDKFLGSETSEYNYVLLEVVEDLSDYKNLELGIATDEFINEKPVIELSGFINSERWINYSGIQSIASDVYGSSSTHISSLSSDIGGQSSGGCEKGGVALYSDDTTAIGIMTYTNHKNNSYFVHSIRIDPSILQFVKQNGHHQF